MSFPVANGYSAKVRLELHIGPVSYSLAQIGGDRLIFDRDVELPGTSGEVRAHIDEHVNRWLATWDASTAPRRIVPAKLRLLN